MGAVRVTASTYTTLWKADLQAALTAIARAGCEGAELMAAPPHVGAWRDPAAEAAGVRRACAPSGAQITSVVPAGLDVNLASPDAAMRDWSVAHYVAVGRIAALVGARFLVVHPGRRHPFKPAPPEAVRDWVLDGVSQIVASLRDEPVRPVFENTPTSVLDTAHECVDVVAAIGPESIGICYDLANGFMVEDPSDGLRTVARHLDLVHASDTTAARWRHDPIGAGEVDFADAAQTIDEIGFHGLLVLETIHDGDVTEGLRQDLAALRGAGWEVQGASAGAGDHHHGA